MSVNAIAMFRGDEKTITFTLAITVGGVTRPLTPTELTGAVIKFTAKNNKADADSAAVIALTSAPGGGIVVDLFGSTATATIPPAATSGLASVGAALDYDLQITGADGKPHTFIVDRLSINADVTRTV